MASNLEAKPAVVLIHGMWGTGETLNEVAQAFTSWGYQTFSPTLPLHRVMVQTSTAERKQLTHTGLDDYLRFLNDYLDDLKLSHGVERPLLVGHSMGGLLALKLASQRPHCGLVLLSPAAPRGISAWGMSVLRTMGRNLLKFPTWWYTLSLNLANVRYGIANTQPQAYQQQITEQLCYESGRAATQILMPWLLQSDTTQVQFAGVSGPVLVISGQQDRITPERVHWQIADRLGGKAKLLKFATACHWTVGGQGFDDIATGIENWLSQHGLICLEHTQTRSVG